MRLLLAGRVVFQVLEQLKSHLIAGNAYDLMKEAYVNLLECTRSYEKQPDGCIVYSNPAYNSRYRYEPIVIEMALGNQSYPVLLEDGVNWLSSYTDVEYAVHA